MPTLPDAVADRADSIEVALREFQATTLPRLAALHPALAPLADELDAFVMRGGKRLRPVLLLLGHELAGGDPDDVLGAAVAVELLHTCALLHDDVIDAAEARRGRPSTHVGFAARHREDDLAGDPDRYGEAVAILLGDLAFVHADEALLGCRVAPDRLLAGLGAFGRLREEVMAGQALDVHAAATRSTDVALALQVATLKSGRYSVTRPLQLGAVLGGADDPLLATLEAVGEPLGRAFQLRDDLLGVFGDEATTGKSTAGDLAEGKRTLLVAEAWARLDDGRRRLLTDRLGAPDVTTDELAAMTAAIEESGARAAVEQRVHDEVAAARDAMVRLPSGPGRDALEQLTDWFATRDA